MNRKLIITIAAAAAITAGSGCAAAAASSTPRGQHGRQSCVVFTLGFKTVTGSEANEPVTVCGTGLRHAETCQLNEPPQPGAVADCNALPAKQPAR